MFRPGVLAADGGYNYPRCARVVVHGANWRWGPREHYTFREHEGRGYWRGGRWIAVTRFRKSTSQAAPLGKFCRPLGKSKRPDRMCLIVVSARCDGLSFSGACWPSSSLSWSRPFCGAPWRAGRRPFFCVGCFAVACRRSAARSSQQCA